MTHADVIYQQMLNALGGQFSTAIGSRAEALVYATSQRLGSVLDTKDLAFNQMLPSLVVDMLPVREHEYGLVPGPNDTISQRQAALTLKMLLPQGASAAAVAAALTAAIGTDFKAYRTTKTSELVSFPGLPGAGPGNWVRIGTVTKAVLLNDSIAVLNVPRTVTYRAANPEEHISFSVGDQVVVSANNIGIAERVTVAAAAGNGFTATFTKPHDPNDFCTTGYFPYWISNQGRVFVFVTPAAAASSEKRRKINTAMEQLMRGVTSWEIIPTTSGTTADLFTTDSATLGRTGYAPTGPALTST